MTTFEENLLASLVLGQGRHLGALVADSTKAENAEVEVNEACVTATKHGWFAELNKTKVLMTGSTLPSCIPSFNLSTHAARQFESQRASYDEEDTDGDMLSALDVARELAGAMELEIKVHPFTLVVVLGKVRFISRYVHSLHIRCPHINCLD